MYDTVLDKYAPEILAHHGIEGQKWGLRRFQNEDGSLTPAGRERYLKKVEKKDLKWAKKNSEKITRSAKKQSRKELDSYSKELLRDPNAVNKSGKLSAATVNAYNRKMAEVMTSKVSDITAPSGRVVRFIAKRGEIGVMMALADQNYNMDQLKRGVWSSGRVAYKKNVLNKVNV